MIDQLTFLMQTYPWIQNLIAALVVARIVFKPTFAILGKYVELTVEDNDNKKLNKFMKSKTYKMIAFIADLAASVKMPSVKKK